MNARLQTIARVLVALAAIALVVFVLRGVNLRETLAILASISPAFLIVTLLLQAGSLTARVVRWKYMLLPVRDIPLATLASPLLISFAVGNVTVTGAGAVPRVYLLNRRTDVDNGFIVGTIVQEFLLDATAVILWAALVPFFVQLPEGFRTVQIVLALPLVVLLLVDVAMWRHRSLALTLLVRLGLWQRFRRFLPSWIRDNLDTFGYGLSASFAHPGTYIPVIGITLLIWMLEALIYLLLLLSLGIPFNYLQASAVTAYTNFAISIIVVPGFVGTLEASSVGMVLALGGTQAATLAFTILLHTFIVVPSTVVGAIFAWREGFHLGQ